MIDRSFQMSIPREELEQIFNNAYRDEDGFVVFPEIILAGGQYTGLLESLIKGDTDQDKRLSLEEFLKYMEQKQA
jgi:Ca2+-binding EF-hand superfamily protein